MLLTLRILTYRKQPVPGAAPVRFSEAGGTLGRGPDNALVLDDPGKYVSRVHARIVQREGAYFLEDVGSNPSVVNDRPLGKGREVMLGHGDRIAIGDYQLEAGLEAAQALPPLAPAPANNPELPLFVPPAAPAPVQLPPLEPAHNAAREVRAAAALPDALAGASILDIGPGAALGAGDDPLGLNLFGAAPAASAPARAAESDHLSPELAAFPLAPGPRPSPPLPQVGAALPERRPGALAIPDDYDPLADLLAPAVPRAAPPSMPVAPAPPAWTEPGPAAPAEPAAADRADPDAAGTVFAAAAAPPSPARPAAPDPARAPAASDSEILQALLRGLGLPDLKLNRPGLEVAETVGALLREATAGTMDVLMARALTKKESRIDVTMLSVRANNPLKFFPNADAALTQMLTNAMAGYMPPLQAMSSAFDDVRAHELAVIAGMRAALSAVLGRFDPAQIESRLGLPTVMDKMFSSGRKARLWDRLVELYGEIARDADDDVQRLFGEKFSEAYEEQVARLRQASRSN
jgi:type VI secretion system FHA domain protein